MRLSLVLRNQKGVQLRRHLGVSEVGRAFFGNDDNIDWGEKTLMKPEKFPQQTFDPVPFNRLTDAFGHHQSPPRLEKLIGRQGDNKMGRMTVSAGFFDSLVFSSFEQPVLFRKASRAPQSDCATYNDR
jgi:hypothetical protein